MADGKVGQFAVPDDATPEQAQSLIEQSISTQRMAAAQQAQTLVDHANPTYGNSGLDNFLVGAGKAFSDLGNGVEQGVANLANSRIGRFWTGDHSQWTKDVQANIDEHKKLDGSITGTTGGTIGNVVGNVAVAAPAMFVPGGQTLAGSAITGAALGALQPTATGESTLVNAGMGAAGGAAGYGLAKLVGSGLNAARSVVQPFSDAGKDSIVGNRVIQALGSDGDVQATLDALSKAKPLVPGADPTAAQAGGNAGLAALQRTLNATVPDSTTMFANRMAEQNAARVAALQDLAGTDGARDFFTAARDGTAKQLYGDAFASGIDPGALTPQLQNQMSALMSRPSIKTAMTQAKSLAEEEGLKLTDMTSVQGLHYVKQALDDQIGASVKAGTDTLTNKLMGTKSALEDVMNQLSSKYADARQTFAAMSKPINQMDVAQRIADSATNPLTGTLQPNAFARALTDKTAKQATGFPAATLEGTFSPEALQTLSAIKDDLARTVFAQNAGRGPGSDTVQKLAFGSGLVGKGADKLLSAAAAVPGFGPLLFSGLKSAAADANQQMAARLAQKLMNPQDTADIIRSALQSSHTSGIINSAMQDIAPYTALTGASTLLAKQQH